MRVDCVNPLDLTPGDIASWRLFLVNQPEFSSPYLTPEWAQAVARQRADACVAIFREGERNMGFLPVQRTSAFAAVPIGGPVCDYQALIGPANATFDLTEAAHALRVGRIDFTAGLRESAVAQHLITEDAGHVARFADGWETWCEARQGDSKIVARTRKKYSKLKRDFPNAVTFEPFSTDALAFDQLITWKREQMWRTGVTDIFALDWVNKLIRSTFEAPATASFGGAMFVLRIDRRPAAVLFCLSARAALHAWFVAYDPRHAEYSPGQILFVEAIRAAAEAGYTEMDLGPGDYRFKESLANARRPVGAGFIGRPGLPVAFRTAEFQLRQLVESLPVGKYRDYPAKAMRRLDIHRGLAPSRMAS